MKILFISILVIALLALLFFGGIFLFHLIRYVIFDTIDFLFYNLWGKPPFSRHCSRGEGYGWQWDEHGNCLGYDPRYVR
ncbi:hypothetical protein [Selenomonas ruminantium]|uniref:Uncharacterized protein n=1 Tax=Selenomonas ruminantium TaxID=971 RepID=A0A1I0V484_SELRU|nr:hypothetical protein [Selenomonas ruminantium]SFA70923.1 hypothetical protein SAMN05216587_101233 [Selenomonas ruminantium]